MEFEYMQRQERFTGLSVCLLACIMASRACNQTVNEMRAASGRFIVLSSATDQLELTHENVENVLDEVRPYLMADGGDLELVEIDGLVVRLRLKGA
eukprot:scaffold389165_cov25-Prasinocladus_malaysianus.AAC.1